jgi:hypothetical protein
MEGPKPPEQPAKTPPPSASRQARLARDAAALRANLLKRKQQAAEREKQDTDRPE